MERKEREKMNGAAVRRQRGSRGEEASATKGAICWEKNEDARWENEEKIGVETRRGTKRRRRGISFLAKD